MAWDLDLTARLRLSYYDGDDEAERMKYQWHLTKVLGKCWGAEFTDDEGAESLEEGVEVW